MGVQQSLDIKREPEAELEQAIGSLEVLLDRRPRSTWRTEALNQVRRLYDDMRAAIPDPSPGSPYAMTLVLNNLLRAANASAHGKHYLFRWISGSDIETAWGGLHGAEEQLLDIQPVPEVRRRLPGIDTALRSNLHADDPRLAEYTARLSDLKLAPDPVVDASRVEIRGFLRDSNAASDAAKANVRSARNRLSLIASITMLLLGVISIAHAVAPGFIDLATKAGGDAPEAWSVILAGSLGGVIGALASVWRVAAAPSADRLPTYQALIRIPLGGAAGLAAVILIRSGFFSALNADGALALLGFALVFGYTPDLLLKYIDQRLNTVINDARGKDDPNRPALSAPQNETAGGLSGNWAVQIQPQPVPGAAPPGPGGRPGPGGGPGPGGARPASS